MTLRANLADQSSREATKMTLKATLFRCQQLKKDSEPPDQNCRGKSIVSPSNKMDIDQDQAMGIHFQEGLLMDIFIRLPMRSLIRFKCVSKFWNALISEPYFTRKHLNHVKNDQNSQKILICQLGPEDGIFSLYCCPLSPIQPVDIQKIDFPSNGKLKYCSIHCCCDGLAIIEVRYNIVDERYILLLSIVLPDPKFPPEGYSRLGLGYDSTSGDYKILKVDENKDDGCEVHGEILTLKSGSWRKICKHPGGVRSLLSVMHSLAFVHGAFHWVGILTTSLVVSFNISNEVYGEIPLPEQICLTRDISIGVSVLEGMLCVYSISNFQRDDTFKLWIMKDYGVKESWNALFTIGDPGIYSPVPKYKFADGELLFWCLHFQCGGNAFRTSRGPFELWPQDVVGILILLTGVMYKGESRRREATIVDESHDRKSITLWGDYAEVDGLELEKVLEDKDVVAFCNVKCTKYLGHVSNFVKMYNLVQASMEESGVEICTTPSRQIRYAKDTTVSAILRSSNDNQEVTYSRFNTKLDEVIDKERLFYTACKRCWKRVKVVKSTANCDFCSLTYMNYEYRFLIKISLSYIDCISFSGNGEDTGGSDTTDPEVNLPSKAHFEEKNNSYSFRWRSVLAWLFCKGIRILHHRKAQGRR